ncbi:MAG: tyrosine-type recombinase/integrase [Alphaproteobacteria bacterium]
MIFASELMASYLQKRRHRWYAVLEIPKALRPHFGNKPRFIQSLETDSRIVAQRRVGPVIAAWRSEIARARQGPNDDAAFFRRALLNAKTEEQRQTILEEIEYAAWDIGAINVDQIGERPSSDPEARRFYASATGQLASFTEHLDEWLATSRATKKTQDMQHSDVQRFAREFETVQDVNRKDVRRWITKLMNGDGLTPKTVQRILSALRGYWRYLQSIEVAGEDHEPFSKLDVARQNKRTGPRSKRQPFEPADVLKLLDAAIERGDDQLADLIRLGMWTGCRIEELCALKVEQVKGDHFAVGEAKTAAGWRDVPIHRELQQAIARLIDDSKDGYVLSGLSENKYGDRSNAVGKRFGKLKADFGFGPQYVFHSIRKTVVTALENAGVAENVVADIVGHEKPSMTFGLYSGGTSLAVKRKALAKLAY